MLQISWRRFTVSTKTPKTPNDSMMVLGGFVLRVTAFAFLTISLPAHIHFAPHVPCGFSPPAKSSSLLAPLWCPIAAHWAGDGVSPPQQIDWQHLNRANNCLLVLQPYDRRARELGRPSALSSHRFLWNFRNVVSLQLSSRCQMWWKLDDELKTFLCGLFGENWQSNHTHFSFRNQF